MAIVLTAEHKAAIEKHGEETFPNECCGFILGKVNGTDRTVVELMRIANAREDEAQYNRFLITPEASFKADKAARAKKLDVIGCYHSHPNAPARPSQYDVDHAAWSGFSHIIVSIRDKVAVDMTSWQLKDDRSAFDSEEIRING